MSSRTREKGFYLNFVIPSRPSLATSILYPASVSNSERMDWIAVSSSIIKIFVFKVSPRLYYIMLLFRFDLELLISDCSLYQSHKTRKVRRWGARPCARSTLRPCALCYSILKILCQLFQTAPDAVTDTAWVYTFRCGDLTHAHTQVISGIDPLGLLLW